MAKKFGAVMLIIFGTILLIAEFFGSADATNGLANTWPALLVPAGLIIWGVSIIFRNQNNIVRSNTEVTRGLLKALRWGLGIGVIVVSLMYILLR